jgi:hypothetical protein
MEITYGFFPLVLSELRKARLPPRFFWSRESKLVE